MTVSDIVSLDTPPKKEAAPIKAMAPGSIHSQKRSVGTPPCRSTKATPMMRPYTPPINLYKQSNYTRNVNNRTGDS